MGIRMITIVENISADGEIEYSVNGNLPLDEAAKALVIVAFTAKKSEKKGESSVMEHDPP